MPWRKSPRGVAPRTPFPYMPVGSSFIYGGPLSPERMSTLAYRWGRKLDAKFSRRKLPGVGWEFRRVW